MLHIVACISCDLWIAKEFYQQFINWFDLKINARKDELFTYLRGLTNKLGSGRILNSQLK